MRLNHKLTVGFMAVSLLVGVVGFLGLYANSRLVNVFESGEAHFDVIVMASTEVSSYAKRAEGHAMLYITLNNTADRQKFFRRIEALRNQTLIIDEYVMNPDARNILANITSDTDSLQSAGELLFREYDSEIRSAGKFEPKSHEELIRNINELSSRIREDGVNLAALETRLKSEQESTAKEKAEVLFNLILAISMSAVFAALVLGYLFAKSIATPIAKFRNVAEELGRGNLDAKIVIDTGDELSELAASFNQMSADLKKSHGEALARAKEAEAAKKELEKKVDELERFNKITIGRELKMIELKKRIKELEEKTKHNSKK